MRYIEELKRIKLVLDNIKFVKNSQWKIKEEQHGINLK
jgi:hypothetical protein